MKITDSLLTLGTSPATSVNASPALRNIGTKALLGGLAKARNTLAAAYPRYRNREISALDCGRSVAVETGKAMAISGTQAALEMAIRYNGTSLGKSLGKKVGGETLKRMTSSNVGAMIAYGGVELACYAVANRKTMTLRDFARKAGATAGEAMSGLGGAAAGAAVGSMLLPGIGTSVGAMVGSMGGSIGSERLGGMIESLVFKEDSKDAPPVENVKKK